MWSIFRVFIRPGLPSRKTIDHSDLFCWKSVLEEFWQQVRSVRVSEGTGGGAAFHQAAAHFPWASPRLCRSTSQILKQKYISVHAYTHTHPDSTQFRDLTHWKTCFHPLNIYSKYDYSTEGKNTALTVYKSWFRLAAPEARNNTSHKWMKVLIIYCSLHTI